MLKENVLKNVHLHFPYLSPDNVDLDYARMWKRATKYGAECSLFADKNTTNNITHLIVKSDCVDNHKPLPTCKKAILVNEKWLQDSMDHWKVQNEELYIIKK